MATCNLTFFALATALCLFYPVNGLDYITGVPYQRTCVVVLVCESQQMFQITDSTDA